MRNWRTLKGFTQFWRDPVALVSRATPQEYVDEVRRAGCDALVAGDERVDLRAALELLAAERGVTRVRVDSGGALAGALLAAGLVHEISLMVYPLLAGGAEEHTFNRLVAPDGALGGAASAALALVGVDQLDGGVARLRYEVRGDRLNRPAVVESPPMDVSEAAETAPRPSAVAGARTRRLGWVGPSIVRGLSLFVGLFLMAGLAGSLRHEGSAESLWLFDAGSVPGPALVGPVLLALAGLVLVAHARAPGRLRMAPPSGRRRLRRPRARRPAQRRDLLPRVGGGRDRPARAGPALAVLAVLMAWCAWVVARRSPPRAPAAADGRLRRAAVSLLTFAACVVLFPLAQIVFFGTTDYRRPADVAVVFGAQVHPAAAPSSTLTWRVDTAVELYREGLVDRLVMSGGVGESGYDEALVMRDMAVERGVPASAIVVDSQGVNTEATVANSVRLFAARGRRPRARRQQRLPPAAHQARLPAAGQEVFTVPARRRGASRRRRALAARGARLLGVLPARARRVGTRTGRALRARPVRSFGW